MFLRKGKNIVIMSTVLTILTMVGTMNLIPQKEKEL